MSYDPAGAPWTDRLGALPNLVALAAVIIAALVGVHGTLHVLFAPASHPPVSMPGVSAVLWGITTVVALGGLAALGGAYASLLSQRNVGRQLDLEILPKAERRVLEPVLETPGITQVEVVARSDYSDAKISQTLKTLCERGLVYREPQGRTYRLYPGTVLDEAASAS